ncbi:unnamed protein product [Amoebophrya sp. A25]|nr:unnamed protein product [Amoebophrya sp. A25]|eukprot:GSA25T00014172001.1
MIRSSSNSASGLLRPCPKSFSSKHRAQYIRTLAQAAISPTSDAHDLDPRAIADIHPAPFFDGGNRLPCGRAEAEVATTSSSTLGRTHYSSFSAKRIFLDSNSCSTGSCSSTSRITKIVGDAAEESIVVPRNPGVSSKRESCLGTSSRSSSEDVEKLKGEVQTLFGNLRAQTVGRIEEFAAVQLFSLAWAFSVARALDSCLYQQLRKRATALALQLDRKHLFLNRTTSQERERPRSKPSSTPVSLQLQQEDHENNSKMERQEFCLSSSDLLEQQNNARPGKSTISVEAHTTSESTTSGVEMMRAQYQELWQKAQLREWNRDHENMLIVAENEHWCVLNKTVRWVVNQQGDGSSIRDSDDDDAAAGESASSSSSGFSKSPSVHDWVRCRYGRTYPICAQAESSYGILHRLDLETSGALLCAKTWLGYYQLRLQWSASRVQKEYLLLCHGHVPRTVTECRGRIKVTKRIVNGKKTCVAALAPTGKPAKTGVHVLAHLLLPPPGTVAAQPLPRSRSRTLCERTASSSSGDVEGLGLADGQLSPPGDLEEQEPTQIFTRSVLDPLSGRRVVISEKYCPGAYNGVEVEGHNLPVTLVRCRLFTGRTHQLRVHFAQELGHPIFGDKKYDRNAERRQLDAQYFRDVLASDEQQHQEEEHATTSASCSSKSGEWVGAHNHDDQNEVEDARTITSRSSRRSSGDKMKQSQEQRIAEDACRRHVQKFGRLFLHTHRLEFDAIGSEDRRERVFVPLSEELRTLLSATRPVDAQSSSALTEWLA